MQKTEMTNANLHSERSVALAIPAQQPVKNAWKRMMAIQMRNRVMPTPREEATE